ncbi:MAG: zinc-binding dehydrogenase [Sulfuricaulis sp.]|nr:zinc-binding dehydrogenase [Sulfuricaulis sp.]
MNTQTAGILRGPAHIEIAELPIPEVGPDDVLIEVAACGICGSDLHICDDGTLPPGSILGHEFSGRITKHGENVSGLPIGSRVTVNPILTRVGLGSASGAFSRFILIRNPKPGRNIFILPDSISDEAGALVEPLSVGLHAVNLAAPGPEDKVAIFGAGTIGLTVLAALKARQVRNIVVFDMSPARLALARTMGATVAANPAESKVEDCISSNFGAGRRLFTGETAGSADIVFDCAGAAAAFASGLTSLRSGGKMVVVASYGKPIPVHLGDLQIRQVSILPSFAYSAAEFAEAIELMASGSVNLTPLISHRFPLEQLAIAFKTQAKVDEAIKVMMDIRQR